MEPARSTARRRARWIVLGVLGLILLSFGGIFLEAWIRAGRTLERERARVADWIEQFRPLPGDVPNLFDPPGEGDGTEHFEKSGEALDLIDSADLDVFPSLAGDEVPRIDDVAIASMGLRLEPALGHLRRAASCRTWEPHRGYEDLVGQKRLSLARVIQWNRILTDLSAHKHRIGDERAALEFAAMGLWIGHAPTRKGFLVDELVRFVTDGIQREGLRKILRDHGGSAADYEWFRRFLDRMESHQVPMIEILRRDDLAMRQALLNAFRDGGSVRDFDPWMETSWGWRKFLPERILLAEFLGWQDIRLQSQIPVVDENPWQRPTISGGKLEPLMKRAPPAPFAVQFERIWHNWLVDLQGTTLARLCLGVAEYEVRNGELPASLQDLVPSILPSVPIDPCNGKPFKYVIQGGAAQVISLGGDGDDDGGRAPLVEDDLEGDGDIVWTVKRKAR